jgi:hypothetical protein
LVAVLIGLTVIFSGLAITGVQAASAPSKPVVGLENPVSIVRSDGGGSDITRIWVAPSDGPFSQSVVNNGLKSIKIITYDITSKPAVVLQSLSIAFIDYGAYPTGTVRLDDLQVQKDHTYKWVFSSTGRAGTSGIYGWDFGPDLPPEPAITWWYVTTVVYVDVSESVDPDGWIVQYEWVWLDGSGAVSFGAIVSHQWEPPVGYYLVNLTLTDNDGMVTSVTVSLGPPFPYDIVGYATSWDGSLLPGTEVTITNLRTGASVSGLSEAEYSFYVVDLNLIPHGWNIGDEFDITARYGTNLVASTHLVPKDPVVGYIWIDLTLYPV